MFGLSTYVDYITLKQYSNSKNGTLCLSTYVDYITLKQPLNRLLSLICLSTYVDYITLKQNRLILQKICGLSTYVDYITLKPQMQDLRREFVVTSHYVINIFHIGLHLLHRCFLLFESYFYY